MMRLTHPAGTKSVKAPDGRVYVAEDGAVSVPDELVADLRLAGFTEALAHEPTEFAKAIEAITRLAAVIEDRPPPVFNITLQQPKIARTVTAERRPDGKLVATIVASPQQE